MQGYVKQEVSKEGIATIEFGHPSHNALPLALLDLLASEIQNAHQNPVVKVILLRSGGDRTFCAGANFDQLLEIRTETEGQDFFMGFAKVISAMRNGPKIIVAQVQGKAVGGGVGLCAAADYVLASKWASVRLSELDLGIGPFVIGPAVERKIGLARFAQLTLNPTEWQTAEWAKSVGLFQEVFAEQAQLEAYTTSFIQRFTNYHSAALQEIKTMLWQETPDWSSLLQERATISGALVVSDYVQTKLRNFKKKEA